jgi:hypothetical protein
VLHLLRSCCHLGLTSFGRSPQQVTERLDELIARIRDIQRPHMNGDKPADVVVVS